MSANFPNKVRGEGRWVYPLLLAVQTIGALIILWQGIPIYRQVVVDASLHVTSPKHLVLAMVAVTLIQTSYWIRDRLQPAMPRHGYVLLAHAVLFVGRLSVIFAGCSFVVVFFAQPDGLHLSLLRVGVLMAVLFSMFCYALELERLGRTLQDLALNQRKRHSQTAAFTHTMQTPKS